MKKCKIFINYPYNNIIPFAYKELEILYIPTKYTQLESHIKVCTNKYIGSLSRLMPPPFCCLVYANT